WRPSRAARIAGPRCNPPDRPPEIRDRRGRSGPEADEWCASDAGAIRPRSAKDKPGLAFGRFHVSWRRPVHAGLTACRGRGASLRRNEENEFCRQASWLVRSIMQCANNILQYAILSRKTLLLFSVT